MPAAGRPVHLVTGGARGIGQAVAAHLSARHTHVVLVDNGVLVDGTRPDSAIVAAAADALPGDADGASIDVSDRAAVESLVADIVQRWGRLDGVVNAAAILRPGSILSMTDGDWERTLEVNLTGTLNVTRAAIAHWLAEGSPGRVVNFTSTAGLEGIPDMFAYATSKAAIIGLTLATSNAVARQRITANVIAPNAGTRMAVRGQGASAMEVRAVTGAWPEFDGMDIAPGHVAPLCGYLLSNAAAHVTGRIFTTFGRTYGRLAKGSPDRTLVLPGGDDWAHVDAVLDATLGDDPGGPSRWASDEVRREADGFPVSELG